MTFSIVARDPETGDLGVAVASKFLAVGSVVSHAQSGVGAVATQALANYMYGSDGLDLLRDGASAEEAVRQLTERDEGRDHRQLGIVDATGHAATYTGSATIDWAGGRTAEGVAAQGNILTGPGVVDALIETYLAGVSAGESMPRRLLSALKAAEDAGGDRRGRQSAALLVVRDGAGYGGNNDRWMDLRVDDHVSPIDELSHLLDLNHLYLHRSPPEDLVPIDDELAKEMKSCLERAGKTPASITPGRGMAAVVESLGVERIGEPREVPDSWDEQWEAALTEWMSVENLEERMAARGWIDPRVLDHLRRTTAA
jgi:uncharacterized Ntn-hydrolase superfamily protein